MQGTAVPRSIPLFTSRDAYARQRLIRKKGAGRSLRSFEIALPTVAIYFRAGHWAAARASSASPR